MPKSLSDLLGEEAIIGDVVSRMRADYFVEGQGNLTLVALAEAMHTMHLPRLDPKFLVAHPSDHMDLRELIYQERSMSPHAGPYGLTVMVDPLIPEGVWRIYTDVRIDEMPL